MVQKEHIHTFVREIWVWYATNRRDLPWRDVWDKSEAERAYNVLVSEVMLQQTQVARVIPTFRAFLRQYPTIDDLAKSSDRDVLLVWRGMGYNRRAIFLRDCAKGIMNIGFFPKEIYQLLALPGIGPYTAAAIRNFAFNIPTPCLDTNIRRVLHRRFIGHGKPNDTVLLALAADILPIALRSSSVPANYVLPITSSSWHHALMDYGALVDVAKKTPQSREEPGRLVGALFTPNRIFRGWIIEELRNTPEGLFFKNIGSRVCKDWNPKKHTTWLRDILEKLRSDRLISFQKEKYFLGGD
jgi:A/G-specific adenine glycosylase